MTTDETRYFRKEQPERITDARFNAMRQWIAIDPDTDFDPLFLEARDALIAERAHTDALEAELRKWRESDDPEPPKTRDCKGCDGECSQTDATCPEHPLHIAWRKRDALRKRTEGGEGL